MTSSTPPRSVAGTDDDGTTGRTIEAWPRASDGRYICTVALPMPSDHYARFGRHARWQHDAAESTGETCDGSGDHFRCRSCGVAWTTYYDD